MRLQTPSDCKRFQSISLHVMRNTDTYVHIYMRMRTGVLSNLYIYAIKPKKYVHYKCLV
jgi:hypothetical protein